MSSLVDRYTGGRNYELSIKDAEYLAHACGYSDPDLMRCGDIARAALEGGGPFMIPLILIGLCAFLGAGLVLWMLSRTPHSGPIPPSAAYTGLVVGAACGALLGLALFGLWSMIAGVL